MRFGAGVKNKVLRPLLAGLPVLTTVHGAHGLRGHPLMRVAATAGEFVEALRRWQAQEPVAASPVAPRDLLDADDTSHVKAWLERQQRDCRRH